MHRLCQYRDILGVPREGVHSYRIPVVDMATFDVVGTIILAFIFAKVFKRNFFLVLLLLYILAECLHYLFCVPTRFQSLLN
jgi:hypothetical protein